MDLWDLRRFVLGTIVHDAVLGLAFRLLHLYDQVVLVDRRLHGSRSVVAVFTAFAPREEPLEGAFGCKDEDQHKLI